MLFIASFSEPSPLRSDFHFFLNWQAKPYTTTLLTAQQRLLSCSCRSRKRQAVICKAVTMESWKSKMQETVQKNRATQQAMDLGITSWAPQTLLKSCRCLPPALIHTLFIPASSTSRTQLHCKIHITDRHPPTSPNTAGQTHLLYVSRAGFARRGFSHKHSEVC